MEDRNALGYRFENTLTWRLERIYVSGLRRMAITTTRLCRSRSSSLNPSPNPNPHSNLSLLNSSNSNNEQTPQPQLHPQHPRPQ
jgi:hypothetical protein